MLATSVGENPEDWEDQVRKACMAYNSRVHATTGFTPFYLMFGRQARIPANLMYGTAEPESTSYGEYATKLQASLLNAYSIARQALSEKQERQSEFYNKKVHGKPHESLVWSPGPLRKVKNCSWRTGPFNMVKRIGSNIIKVDYGIWWYISID